MGQVDDPADQATLGKMPLLDLRSLALERIRHAVWQMRISADLPMLLDVIHVQVRLLGLRYQALGVNVGFFAQPLKKETISNRGLNPGS